MNSSDWWDGKLPRMFESDLPILILGETGTGKTHLAMDIHSKSKVCDGKFLHINCAGISPDLAESQLFGCVEGAYTGAKSSAGAFEEAKNGTIFLDEITELSLGTQAKLLQVLSEKTYMRLGSNKVHKSNARVICATNEDLAKLVKKGKFRKDLYFRILTFVIRMMPLRERVSEIPQLVLEMLDKKHMKIRKEALLFLMDQEWEGNIRQLENCINFVMCMSDSDVVELIDVERAYEATKPW